MDFSKLSSNEKLAVYGAVAAIVGSLISQFGSIYGAGGLWLSTLLAIAMIVVIFLPQWSPSTALPGSKGSLMLVLGGIAGVGAVLGLLAILPALGAFAVYGGVWFIGVLIGIVGGLLMGWAGWKEFQAEGGKFTIGTASGGTSAAAQPPPMGQAAPPPEPMAPPPPMTPPAPTAPPEPMAPAEPMGADEPMGTDEGSDEERPS